MSEKKNIGVILAGGSGNRFGAALPKQYNQVNGKEIIGYVIDAFKGSESVDDVFVVAHADYVDLIKAKYGVEAVFGGDTRNVTVFNALKHIREFYPDCENVVFADSARPMLKSVHLDDICKMLGVYDAVITIAAITDSLGYKNGDLVDRADYYLVQTPEAFRLKCLESFDLSSSATAIIQQSACKSVFHYDKIKNNFKVTYPDDLSVVKALLEVSK